MCGLLFSNDQEINKRQFLVGLDKQSHRGPDAKAGYAYIAGTHLGHNRLKILDLDNRSNQPMMSLCGKYSIIYN